MKEKGQLRLYKYAVLFIFLFIFGIGCSVWAASGDISKPYEETEEKNCELFEDQQEAPDDGMQKEQEPVKNDEGGDCLEEDLFQSADEAEMIQNDDVSIEDNASVNMPEEESKIQEELTDSCEAVFTDGTGANSQGTHTIIHENGLHYIEDPQYPGYRILIYCMNNQLNWPHHTDSMGENQVPGYTEGYLHVGMFDSEEDYQECMRRLAKLLYIGYPYNGERLYKIVSDSESYAPTEEEFNEMLIPHPALQTAFPEIGHHVFAYQDWINQDEEHLQVLGKFIQDVEKIRRGGTTVNGLTYSDITVMPFYKAAMSMTWQAQETPLEIFALFYGASYFVTEQQAYDATQLAVWRLMHFYNIPDNNIDEGELNVSPLGKTMYIYSEKDGILDHKPSSSELKLEADLIFRYNPKDGMYHSGNIRIIEPENYHGLYRLLLPKGVTAQCDNLTYVYGGEDYQLVATELPTDGASFGIEADFAWLQDFKQYSPQPDIEVNGKKFQHMVGAVIRNTSINAQIPYDVREEGGLKVIKNAVGGDPDQEFRFRLELPYHNHIEGLYGDLFFREGVAEFTLKSGESKKAVHLPAGAEYKVTETDTGEYEIRSVNESGMIQNGNIQEVTFTNIRLPELILSKEVTGEAGDKTREFPFEITLKKSDGTFVNGIFSYKGGIKSGCEAQGIQAPEDGKLEFKDGKAQIMLSHGQQIQIQNLPYKSFYTVTETVSDSYHTTYNGMAENASGQLTEKSEVHVVNNKEFAPDTGIEDISDRGAGAMVIIAFGAILLLAGEIYLKKRIKK